MRQAEVRISRNLPDAMDDLRHWLDHHSARLEKLSIRIERDGTAVVSVARYGNCSRESVQAPLILIVTLGCVASASTLGRSSHGLIDGVFRETQAYSDREIGLGLWQKRIVPWVQVAPTNWFGGVGPDGARTRPQWRARN